MNQNLVNNEQEFIGLFDSVEMCELEVFLGIEYAYEDGKFQDDKTCNEELDASSTIYRKHDHCIFPEEYPCLVIWEHSDDFDRIGSVKVRFLWFVYKKDFLGVEEMGG